MKILKVLSIFVIISFLTIACGSSGGNGRNSNGGGGNGENSNGGGGIKKDKWAGTTSRGNGVTFSVSGNEVLDFVIEICVSGGSGGFGCFESALDFSLSINGSSFNYSSYKFDVSGTFNGTTCTGNWKHSDGFMGYGSGTWEASFITTPYIVLSESSHNFGRQLIDTAGSTFMFTLSNRGNVNASGTVYLTDKDADQFEIISGGGSYSLSSGQSKNIDVRFNPTSTDLKAATLMVDGDSPGNDDIAFLEGTGSTQILVVTPNYREVTRDNGSVDFNVNNTGLGTMHWITETDPEDTWLTVTDGNSGTDSGTITVSYEANNDDARTGVITVTAAGADNSPRTVEVRQAGRTPKITFSPMNYGFDDQLLYTASDTVTFTLSNDGGGTATGSVSLTGTDADEYEIIGGGGSFTLSYGQSKDINVQFSPSSKGIKAATLLAVGNAPTNDANASLTGTGTYPTLSVTPDSNILKSDAGSATFAVANSGPGTISWIAERDPADTWITIAGGSSGTDSGTIAVNYEANTGDTRTGSITVTAAGAADSPQTVEVIQNNSWPEWKLSAGGGSVSISGDYAIVGNIKTNNNAAYVFKRSGNVWTRLAKLTSINKNNQFGISVSISGDYAIVGARSDSSNGYNYGAAYIFERPSGGWVDMTETAKLTASDGKSASKFGNSVSISGDYAVAGADGDGSNGNDSGAAYVFEKPAGGWVDMTETAKLTASDAAFHDYFGSSVSISGDHAIVGAYGDDRPGYIYESGSVYIFKKPAGGWVDMTETAKLTASDGASRDYFGSSVSISGDYAVAGADGDGSNGNDSGAAYVFEKPAGGWVDMTETAKLTARDGAAGDRFGNSVSTSGDYAIIGAYRDDDNGNSSGSAYIFEKPAGGWIDMIGTSKLTAGDGAGSDQFGGSVSISGDYAIVGSSGYSGLAYIFGIK